jgi:adenosylhomocysteine nucleosidase
MQSLVCFAMKEEAAAFRKIAARRSDVGILIVGIGQENAGRSIRKNLAGHSPALVLTCGFAGGLNPDLKIGDVVFDLPAKNKSEPTYVGCCKKLEAAGAKPVKFFCADHIATTVGQKTKLRLETRADAVEMESAAIHAVCDEKNIPCVTVRVISDTAHEDLPLDFNSLAKPDKSMDYGKLMWAIARSPGKIGALMALQKKTSFAGSQMAAVLEKIIPG